MKKKDRNESSYPMSTAFLTKALLLLIICSGIARTTNAQLLEKRISLSLKDVPFEEVIVHLEESTGIKFAYSLDQVAVYEKISIESTNRTLGEVLRELLAPRNINFTVHETERLITLKRQRKNDRQASEDQSSSLLLRGTIRDVSTMAVMPGVNVIVKGTTRGTTTDADGNFSINAEEDEILVFSFIGYTTLELKVFEGVNLSLVMSEDVKNLGEVVINAGYYKTTREMQTGNIVKVTAEEISRQPVQNAIAALDGRVPGLEITQSTGVPGGNFKVRIRGTNSLSSGNDPLYIIDGVPFQGQPMTMSETSGNILGSSTGNGGSSPLNFINPADIESIEVLKDADATAIYGSRGANGVILITTKKGTQGKTHANASFYTGIAQVPRSMALLSTTDYLTMRKEAFTNAGTTPNASNAPDLITWDSTRTTDWQKKLIGNNARITDAQMSLSGGEQRTTFQLGAGYHKETTVFPGDNKDERISLNSALNHISPDEKLNVSLQVKYSANKTTLLSEDLTQRALTLSPNAPTLYDDGGDVNWEGWTATIENPIAFTERTYESTTNTLMANMGISYAILKSLSFSTQLGYTKAGNDGITVLPASSYAPGTVLQNKSIFSRTSFRNWIIEPQLAYEPQINDNHKVKVLAGLSFLDQESERLAQYANGFTSESLMKNIAAASSITAASTSYAQYRYSATFARLNYSLLDKYIINLTGRRDGSSRFGPGKQFAFFGAAGAAWIFSKEDFLRNALPVLSFGKLKASYGSSGNDQIGDYQYLDTYKTSGNYDGKVGLAPARLNNPDFAWEKNLKFEAAIELGFIDQRIQLSASYYSNTSTSQLVGYPLAPTTGFASIQRNFPAKIRNSGLELQVESRNVDGSAFTWTTLFNLTLPRNELVEFDDITRFPSYDTQFKVGEPLNIRKLYVYEGVDPETGLYTFTDVNEDGTFDQKDRVSIASFDRRAYGGFQNTLMWKGFTLDFLFQFVSQRGFNYTHMFLRQPGALSNQPDFVTARWESPGSETDIQQYSVSSGAATAYSSRLYNSDRAISDASFIRLRNIYLSYNFSNDVLERLHLTKLTLFTQGQNVITFSKYKGINPELPGSAILPSLRTITAGVQITL